MKRRTVLKSTVGVASLSSIPTVTANDSDSKVWVPAGREVDKEHVHMVETETPTPPWKRQGWRERRDNLTYDENAEERREDSSSDEVSTQTTNRAWLSYAEYIHSDEVTFFETEWDVPETLPSWNSDFTLFTFPALQNCSSGFFCSPFILQPVLQWNFEGNGRWEIASWYGSSDEGYSYSMPISVNPGDTIYGEIEKQDDRWRIGTWNLDANEGTVSYSNNTSDTFNEAYVALEGVEHDCNWLPDRVDFEDIVLRDGSTIDPSWSAGFNDRQNGNPEECDTSVWYPVETSPSYVYIRNEE